MDVFTVHPSCPVGPQAVGRERSRYFSPAGLLLVDVVDELKIPAGDPYQAAEDIDENIEDDAMRAGGAAVDFNPGVRLLPGAGGPGAPGEGSPMVLVLLLMTRPMSSTFSAISALAYSWSSPRAGDIQELGRRARAARWTSSGRLASPMEGRGWGPSGTRDLKERAA